MTNKFTTKEIKIIKDRIDNLSLDGKKEIFRIIKDNNERYNTNQSSILLDLSRLSYDTLAQLRTFLNFSEEKQKALIHDEESRDNFRNLIQS
jgi:hypothetical protein